MIYAISDMGDAENPRNESLNWAVGVNRGKFVMPHTSL